MSIHGVLKYSVKYKVFGRIGTIGTARPVLRRESDLIPTTRNIAVLCYHGNAVIPHLITSIHLRE